MKPAGYAFLVQHFNLHLPPLSLDLYSGNEYADQVIPYGQRKRKILAKTKVVGTTPSEHLATAIKYQGIRLNYLSCIFPLIDKTELTQYIKSSPTSVLTRSIWYLYEWIQQTNLDVDDSKTGSYIKLMEDEYYFTLKSGEKSSRHRVENNMLGNRYFSPLVRKTPELVELAKCDVMEMALMKIKALEDKVNTETIGRSLSYLYTKETKSSTEIEKEDSRATKTQRFFQILKTAGSMDLTKQRLLHVQNQIVQNEQMKNEDYRDHNIYVGTNRKLTSGGSDEEIHYIAPHHNQVAPMMTGLLDAHEKLMIDNQTPVLIHSTVISFGFVYIHPMEDGNGRLHRYLIHDILKQRSANHKDFIIPVSSAILSRMSEYDRVLETLSVPVMASINYTKIENEVSSIQINNDINYLYRYPDMTEHAIFLYRMMETAITDDLISEVLYIIEYDEIKKFINGLIDLPNQYLDKLVAVLIEKKGTLSNNKNKKYLRGVPQQDLDEIEEYSKKAILQTESVIKAISQGELITKGGQSGGQENKKQ
ncbi:MAG: Fic family protein [Sediminicola sp.]|jgi:Fic family protein